MPVYTYICKDCGQNFDLLVGMTYENVELKCKRCGSKNIKKTFGTFNVGGPGDKANSSGSGCPTGVCPTGY